MKKHQKIKEKLEQYEIPYIALKTARIYGMYYLNKLTSNGLERLHFYQKLGYWPDINNPKTFNEKLLWKKTHDRNPLLPVVADKYEIRSYIKNILGEEQAEEILIPLLYVTERPDTIPFETLPSNFIIKPNHTSGTSIVVENGQYEKENIIKTCREWLRTPYGLEKLEWAYQPIQRKIIIEQLLREKNGGNPKEYRFYMFNGKCHLVYVILDRLNDPSRSLFDEEWNYLAVKKAGRPMGQVLEKPEKYSQMLRYAEQFSAPFDFVRVDFYYVKNKIYAGELTHYPTSGKLKFEPGSFDFELGNHWKIKSRYWIENE